MKLYNTILKMGVKLFIYCYLMHPKLLIRFRMKNYLNCYWKSYHDAINQSLNDVDISKDLVECRNVDCTVHKSMIAFLYNKIIVILTAAAKHAIHFTSPKLHYIKSQPGWNEHVSVIKDEAMNWHVIWKMSGSPHEGYVFRPLLTEPGTRLRHS